MLIDSAYLSFNLKSHEWNQEFDYAWLYREQPPITSIEVLIKSLLYNE